MNYDLLVDQQENVFRSAGYFVGNSILKEVKRFSEKQETMVASYDPKTDLWFFVDGEVFSTEAIVKENKLRKQRMLHTRAYF